jgi:serine protease Do
MKKNIISAVLATLALSTPVFSEPEKPAAAAPQITIKVESAGGEKTAYLGVVTSSPDAQLRSQLSLPEGMGLSVDAVGKDSPAEKAGLKKFDVLTRFNDQLLANADQLSALVKAAGKDAKVKLTLIRKGHEQSVEATLGEHDADLTGGGGAHAVAIASSGDSSNIKVFSDGLKFDIGKLGDEIKKLTPELGGKNIDVKELQERINKQVKEATEKAAEAAKKAGADAKKLQSQVQIFSAYPNATSNSESHVVWKDDDGEVELVEKNGKRTFTAKDADGKQIFHGPVNTAADRAALPEKLREKLAQVEKNKASVITIDDAAGNKRKNK